MRCKTFETLIKTIYMPLCTNKHPHLIYFLLFFCWMFTSNLMLECLHFIPTARSLYDDEGMLLYLGRC